VTHAGRAYPYTIDNGGGQRITFLGRRHAGEAEYLDVENELAAGAGPPMHVHFHQDEQLTVVSGSMGYQFEGDAARAAKVGETVKFARGVAHRFWNAGSEPLRCTGWITPPLGAEPFLAGLYAGAAAHDGRPDLFVLADLLHRYRHETRMVGLPRALRILLPLIGWLRRLKP
jgi:quercetin dioxygenase-like cupin family protein